MNNCSPCGVHLSSPLKIAHEQPKILAGLHAVMALVRHFGLRDNTLRRMLPGRGSN
ncbi:MULTISPECIES: hypothetical protein [unclassified Pseudomonas]|uniref:hypothetical protein n=1 Tax=Pseudomonas TaxID=286 RepID=UPI0024B32269|nr:MULTISPECIES: hypothetical protein [unclassified Pseudomonas]